MQTLVGEHCPTYNPRETVSSLNTALSAISMKNSNLNYHHLLKHARSPERPLGWAWALGVVAKMLVGMATIPIQVPLVHTLLPIPFSVTLHPRRQQAITQAVGSLHSVWETWTGVPAPGLGLILHWMLQASGG